MKKYTQPSIKIDKLERSIGKSLLCSGGFNESGRNCN